MKFHRMETLSLAGKRVLIREDLNVPVKDGVVGNDTRIRAALPTLKLALERGAHVIVMSHLGRPQEGLAASDQQEISLAPVATHLSTLLGSPVVLDNSALENNTPVQHKVGVVTLLENVRMNNGEGKNDDALAKRYAALCDVFVMDAFGTAHRAQASTHGVAKFAPNACAGPLLKAELDALGKAMDNPKRPLVAIVGGSKVSTKLTVLNSLAPMVDQLIVGGGIANTFIAAEGHAVGGSLYEADLIPAAQKLQADAQANGGNIPVPTDVVTGKAFSADTEVATKPASEITADEMVFDIGPDTAATLCEILKNAGTIVWNGPVGVFELAPFAAGTKAIAEAIAESSAFSIAGGGDTLAAVDMIGI